MKTTQSILSRFENTAGVWLTSLSQYSEAQFAKKPNADSWSIGQVYNHLVAGTRLYHLQQIAQCLEGKQTERNGRKQLPGKLTFFLGSFPPIRIKVPPSETYTPKQPQNIDTMKSGLEKLIKIMRETEQKLSGVSEISKTAHPAFGFLNAREWFHLIEMHFRLHLRQKKRLDHFLAQ
jgi:DinB superfamily